MPFHTCFIGVAAFLQASIVEFTTEIEHPIQVVCRGFVGRDSILVGFDAHGSLGLWKETDNSLPVSSCYIPLLLPFLQNGHGQRFGARSEPCAGLSAAQRYPTRRISSSTNAAIFPVKIPLRYLGHQTKW